MKNVLIVFTTGFVSWGGLTTVMMNYWRNMNHDGLKIDFACYNNPNEELIKEIEKGNSYYYKLPNRKNIIKYIWKLKQLSKGYDILYVNGNSATSILEMTAAILAGVKKRYVHNHNSETTHPLLNKLFLPLFRYSYTKAFACSLLAGEWLFGNEGKNFMVLKNAVDVERFKFDAKIRAKIRKSLGLNNDVEIIGHVGKMVKAKNHVFMIRVFLHLLKGSSQRVLLLVGDGIMREEIEKNAKEMGIYNNIIFLGMRNDIPELLQAMDIFLFPSIFEGLPLAVLEAQAAGLPCYLSNNITKEVGIGEDVCYLDLNLSPDKWAETINKQQYNITRKERCERNIKRLSVAGYNIRNEADKLRDIYLDKF